MSRLWNTNFQSRRKRMYSHNSVNIMNIGVVKFIFRILMCLLVIAASAEFMAHGDAWSWLIGAGGLVVLAYVLYTTGVFTDGRNIKEDV